MIEPQPTQPIQDNEPQPQNTEILTPKFYGVSAILLQASNSTPDLISNIVNPDHNIGVSLDEPNPNLERNYTQITQSLSSKERRAAWQGNEFEPSITKWKSKLTEIATTTKNANKKHVIEIISGKNSSEFTEIDAQNVFNLYCDGVSKTSKFVTQVVSNLKTEDNQKIDIAKLKSLEPEIKWMAHALFGEKTAEIVMKFVEIEASMQNNPKKTVETLFTDNKNRLNNLNEEEKVFLKPLYDSLKEITPPSNIAPPPEKDEDDEVSPEIVTSTSFTGSSTLQEQKPLNWIEPNPFSPITATPEQSEPEPTTTPKAATVAQSAPTMTEPIVQPSQEPEPTTTPEAQAEKPITLSANSVDDLKRELIYNLGIAQNERKDRIEFGMDVKNIASLISSIAGDQLVSAGEINLDENNQIHARNMRIDTKKRFVGVVTINVTIFNNPNHEGEISIRVEDGPGLIKGEIDKALKEKIGQATEKIDEMVKSDYPRWKTDNISISSENKQVIFGLHPTTPLSTPG